MAVRFSARSKRTPSLEAAGAALSVTSFAESAGTNTVALVPGGTGAV